jgi:hypothetical protein
MCCEKTAFEMLKGVKVILIMKNMVLRMGNMIHRREQHCHPVGEGNLRRKLKGKLRRKLKGKLRIIRRRTFIFKLPRRCKTFCFRHIYI